MTTRTQPQATSSERQGDGPRRTFLTKASSTLLLRPETTIIAVIIAIGVFATVRNSTFASPSNLTEILRATVVYFVMACGATLLVIGGGLDFSVGSTFTLGGLVCSLMLVHGVGWPLAVLGGIAVGIVVGVVNHSIIEYLHVPPIIATLGAFYFIDGLNIQITGGQDVLPLPDNFQQLGQGSIFGVPNIVCYAVVVGAMFWFLLERTPYGINVRALGGNRHAAIGNGLRVGRLSLALYVCAGATAALGGIIYAARVGGGQVSAGGSGITLSVVTAVLIGGTSLFGGLGTVTGTVVGAILLSEIDNALVLSNIPPQYNSMIIGSILVAAVAADHLRRKRLYRR